MGRGIGVQPAAGVVVPSRAGGEVFPPGVEVDVLLDLWVNFY